MGCLDVRYSLRTTSQADLHCLDGCKNQPLAWAAAGGQKQAVEALLELGADPLHRNDHDKSALDLLGQGAGT
eukprot:1737282-Rhodomonas_salina.1